jgi:hypothetical protein
LGAERLATAAVVALVLTSGLATALGISPMLACLVSCLRGDAVIPASASSTTRVSAAWSKS